MVIGKLLWYSRRGPPLIRLLLAWYGSFLVTMNLAKRKPYSLRRPLQQTAATSPVFSTSPYWHQRGRQRGRRVACEVFVANGTMTTPLRVHTC